MNENEAIRLTNTARAARLDRTQAIRRGWRNVGRRLGLIVLVACLSYGLRVWQQPALTEKRAQQERQLLRLHRYEARQAAHEAATIALYSHLASSRQEAAEPAPTPTVHSDKEFPGGCFACGGEGGE